MTLHVFFKSLICWISEWVSNLMCRHMTFHHIILTTQITEGGKIVKGAVTPIISLVEHLLQARSGLNVFAYVIPMKPSSIQWRELLLTEPSFYRRRSWGLETLRNLPKDICLIVNDNTGMELGLPVFRTPWDSLGQEVVQP